MRVWSKGLGNRELVLDFAEGNVTREGDKVFIRGVIQQPVAWNYEVTITNGDIPGLLHIIFSTAVLRHFARNVAGIFTFVRNRSIERQTEKKLRESHDS